MIKAKYEESQKSGESQQEEEVKGAGGAKIKKVKLDDPEDKNVAQP